MTQHDQTARHNNKSPCTDGEVTEMVTLLGEHVRYQYMPALARQTMERAADLLTRLSAERDRLEGERNNAQRDVLDRMGERDRALDLYAAALAERDALKARVAELEAGLIEALRIIDPIADVVKCARLYALSGDRS